MDLVLIGEILAVMMFFGVITVLLLGFPVAFSLAGTALLFAAIGMAIGIFDPSNFGAIAGRFVGFMTNEVLVAVPLFIFMGIALQRSGIAEQLLVTMGKLFGNLRGGLGISVIVVGALLATSTGVVGATVVTMGLISLPAMMRAGYDPKLAAGVICASGTLGQIIPPSTVMIFMGDMLAGINAQVQMSKGNFAPDPVSVGSLFAGAVFPSLVLIALYLGWMIFNAIFNGKAAPATPVPPEERGQLMGEVLSALLPPLLREVCISTATITSMVFILLFGAALFAIVFRIMGGENLVHEFLVNMPGGAVGATIVVMLIMFVLGFILDTFEIIFIVVPITAPVLLALGVDPVWLGVAVAVNLQTSFMTPPFGFSLLYLRSVAPAKVTTGMMYRGALPFVVLQIVALGLLFVFPDLATWLPSVLYG
jgi:TRAP-type mannitol/chloroaromatic compound transport system permease large subunit